MAVKKSLKKPEKKSKTATTKRTGASPASSISHYWGILVAVLYGLLLALLTVPVLYASFVGAKSAPSSYFSILAEWGYWGIIAGMILAQFLFLGVTLRFTREKPVERLPILITVLSAGLMMGFLFLAAFYSVHEIATNSPLGGSKDLWGKYLPLSLAFVFWLFWAWIFHRMKPADVPGTREADTSTWMNRISRTLLAGSILELLIAVPAHIVARGKTYCCAGISTFLGISTGIAVVLFSFGPAVLILFFRRLRKLKPKA
ncbi:MAG: hypothetical protein JNM63_14730 [Spirochaetia bacterium]|nr:hypothetical protein [Spirochaetia bacterium]